MAKKFNTNNNLYIIIYSIVYTSLKDKQEANVALDVKKQVLAALDIREFADDADAEEKYKQIVVAVDTVSAEKKAIVYTCKLNGEDKYILSVNGMGLWGPIWGYIALNSDKQTVFGAYFNHASETAGLGAEIKDSKAWQDQFKGKTAYADNTVLLSVKKATDIKPEEKPYTVDAVTGSTLTCNGVNNMFKESIALYEDFLNNK